MPNLKKLDAAAQAVLDKHKSEGKVSKLTIELKDGQEEYGYFKEANRHVVSAVLASIARDPLGATLMWIESCLIKEISSPVFLSEDKDILATCYPHANTIAEVKKSTMTTV